MKRLLPCFMALLLLSGCDLVFPEPEEITPTETLPEETSEPETLPETEPPVILTETQAETVQETLSAGAYYRAHLLELLEGVPSETDETEADTAEPTEASTAEATEETTAPAGPGVSRKQFALLDIDGDGREELIVLLTEGDSVTEYILDDAQEELWLHSAAVFYPNGAAETASGEGEAFTPYTLYQYDAERDVYYEVAHVEALVLAELEEAGLADEYPEDIDVSESGRVYLIGSGDPVDAADYELWVSSWRTEPMAIPFAELTKENIETIKD